MYAPITVERNRNMVKIKTARAKNVLLILGGLAAGFLNGLLGAGGGILLVAVLGMILTPAVREDLPDFDKKDIFAGALAAMLPVTAVSVISYASSGSLSPDGAEYLIFPAILGGLGGALLLDRMSFETVRKIFSLIVIFSGIAMLVRN